MTPTPGFVLIPTRSLTVYHKFAAAVEILSNWDVEIRADGTAYRFQQRKHPHPDPEPIVVWMRGQYNHAIRCEPCSSAEGEDADCEHELAARLLWFGHDPANEGHTCSLIRGI